MLSVSTKQHFNDLDSIPLDEVVRPYVKALQDLPLEQLNLQINQESGVVHTTITGRLHGETVVVVLSRGDYFGLHVTAPIESWNLKTSREDPQYWRVAPPPSVMIAEIKLRLQDRAKLMQSLAAKILRFCGE
jgi:hypothetical protein